MIKEHSKIIDTNLNNAVIYKLISPSNKVYIGQSINLRKRYSNYKSHKGWSLKNK
jgi:predicted GIY-YIG superfamily endonuclease